jgi:hypothetical protein
MFTNKHNKQDPKMKGAECSGTEVVEALRRATRSHRVAISACAVRWLRQPRRHPVASLVAKNTIFASFQPP